MRTVDVLMEDRSLSIDELASQCRLEPQRILAIVDGRWLPNPQERELIAAALGVPVTDVSWGHTMNPRNVRYHRFGLKEDF